MNYESAQAYKAIQVTLAKIQSDIDQKFREQNREIEQIRGELIDIRRDMKKDKGSKKMSWDK